MSAWVQVFKGAVSPTENPKQTAFPDTYSDFCAESQAG
jgi:hypothetical protein